MNRASLSLEKKLTSYYYNRIHLLLKILNLIERFYLLSKERWILKPPYCMYISKASSMGFFHLLKITQQLTVQLKMLNDFKFLSL